MFLFVKWANYTKRVCVVVYETKHSQGFTLTLSSLHVDYSCLFYFQLRKNTEKRKKKMVLLSRTIQKFSVEIKKLQQCDSCLWIKTVWSHWEQFVKDCFKKMVLICVWVLALLATWFSFNLVYMQSVWNAMFYTVCCGFLFSSPFFLSRLHPHFSSHLRHVSHCVQQEKKRGKK